MSVVWTLLVALLGIFLVWSLARRWVEAGGRKTIRLGNGEREMPNSEAGLWPDRTGPRTRAELGARHAMDTTFVGDREEKKGDHPQNAARPVGPQGGQAEPRPPGQGQASVQGRVQPLHQTSEPVTRRQAKPGPHEHGPGTNPNADLAPEDEFGEDRPANRTTAPDQPPTQWHPKDHGVPGDHYREGHHRSATGPERHSTATDPYAHAPTPGPNHLTPEGGADLPPGVQP